MYYYVSVYLIFMARLIFFLLGMHYRWFFFLNRSVLCMYLNILKTISSDKIIFCVLKMHLETKFKSYLATYPNSIQKDIFVLSICIGHHLLL